MKKLLVCLTGLAMTVSATALPMTQEQVIDVWDIDYGTFTYLFDQFDDQGGQLTLQSVGLEVSLTDYHAHYYVNTTGQIVTLTVHTAEQSYGFGGPSGLGANLTLDLSDQLGDYIIPDGGDLLLIFVDQPIFLSSAISDGLAAYIGSGTVGIAIEHDGVAWAGEAATSGLSWESLDMTTEGTVKLTYAYVPEPATLALLGLGAVGLLRKRK